MKHHASPRPRVAIFLALLPMEAATFTQVLGLIEIAVGLAILNVVTRIGAWGGGVDDWDCDQSRHDGMCLDLAVRDLEIAIPAYVLGTMFKGGLVARTEQRRNGPSDANAGVIRMQHRQPAGVMTWHRVAASTSFGNVLEYAEKHVQEQARGVFNTTDELR